MTLLLTERHIKAMVHCIGLDQKNPYKRHGKLFYRPYRNYFATRGPDCDGVDIWLDLERHNYAVHGFGDWRWSFTLTRAGLDVLGDAIGVHIHDA